MQIDEAAFRRGHDAFLSFVEAEAKGVPFVDFDHPYLVREEVAYKYAAYSEGRRYLALERWGAWRPGDGRMLAATKAACAPSVSRNLLEHRYGEHGDSASPLARVRTSAAIAELENALKQFLLVGGDQPLEFGPRFDEFAKYLRDRKLGCKWPFLAYLSFLLNPAVYFPILPGRFDALLKFYGIGTHVSGRVEWRRYNAVLELAGELKERLAIYRPSAAIHVQSYMWVVAALVVRGATLGVPPATGVDPEAELLVRQARAVDRERIGLLGEQHVVEVERRRLREAGRSDFADRVRWVSLETDTLGYDVLSFTVSGEERHIEVKATSRPEGNDDAFWLSDRERQCGEGDPLWRVVRVWLTTGSVTYRDLGNILREPDGGWCLQPSSWRVVRVAA